eukprot:TRINITY_DN68321_c0_g1_i1.p1 TRINITY_DN68321_c0_g1~~TRINITY_DN68321_c0_g1_i1.p1  ORF type:complete len:417 (+),score=46.38 TRINITY_DN68321_c0_g1_i1:131-1252(+)
MLRQYPPRFAPKPGKHRVYIVTQSGNRYEGYLDEADAKAEKVSVIDAYCYGPEDRPCEFPSVPGPQPSFTFHARGLAVLEVLDYAADETEQDPSFAPPAANPATVSHAPAPRAVPVPADAAPAAPAQGAWGRGRGPRPQFGDGSRPQGGRGGWAGAAGGALQEGYVNGRGRGGRGRGGDGFQNRGDGFQGRGEGFHGRGGFQGRGRGRGGDGFGGGSGGYGGFQGDGAAFGGGGRGGRGRGGRGWRPAADGRVHGGRYMPEVDAAPIDLTQLKEITREEAEDPDVGAAYSKSSFFDNLTYGDGDAGPLDRNARSEQRQRDAEAFGSASVQAQYRRQMARGRGRGGGGGGRGGRGSGWGYGGGGGRRQFGQQES